MNQWDDKIKKLLNKNPDMQSFGTPDYLQDIPDWMNKQSEVGLGKDTENAMFRLGIRRSAGREQQTLRDLIKKEGATGIGGGFTTQAETEVQENFQVDKANLEFEIGQKSDSARLQAMREKLGIDQFNKNLTFQYQDALMTRDMTMRQMKLSELLQSRQMDFDREMQADNQWLDFAGNIIGTAISFI